MFWLDTNVFVQAKNLYYKFDRVPGFWAALDKQLKAGTIRSSIEVFNELTEGTDYLSQWIKTRESLGLSVPVSGEITRSYRKMADWVKETYDPEFAAHFFRRADGWVIAHAMHEGRGGATVVTHEVIGLNHRQQENNRRQKVRIPKVCEKMEVDCIDTFQMIERLDMKF